MVVLPQNPSTEDGQIPGCSCILSVGSSSDGGVQYRKAGVEAQLGRHVRTCAELGGAL